MKFNTKATIYLEGDIEPSNLVSILRPENNTLPGTDIESMEKNLGVETKISGKLTIGSLNRILDDIIATTILAVDVSRNSK